MAANVTLTVTGKHQLKDGFQELFIFRGHRLQLRGFNLVEWLEDTRRGAAAGGDQYSVRFHFYISWDVKQVLLWKHDFQGFNAKPQLLNQVKFSNQPNYVCAIVHVTKMKVFLAAALDMSFKIFDRHLNLLESIHHEERAILQIEYDIQKDLIFSSGATGISVWKLYRNLSLDKSHVMEKLYSFDGCDTWITHMIYEPAFNRIYALKERSAQVLSLTRRSVITTLENVHDAPINAICWYERNQFYITGCSRGEIKCWTSNFNYRKANSNDITHATAAFNQFSHHQDENLDDVMPGEGLSKSSGNHSGGKKFALLHTFKGHTKAVTAIKLHPVSGLAITTSLDGFVKILNLESLNELFTIQCDAGIINMRILNLGGNHHACLFAFTDATIRLWKITSVCDFFSVTSAKINSFQIFDNLEGELEYDHRTNKHNINASILKAQFGEYRIPGLFSSTTAAATTNTSLAVTKTNPTAAVNNVNSDNNHTNKENAEDEADDLNIDKGLDQILAEKIIVTESSQDFRAFTHTGVLIGRLEPEHVVDSIIAYTVSVHQKLLICLCEGDKIRVHCLRRFGFPLLFETSLKGPLANKMNESDANGTGSMRGTNPAAANSAASGNASDLLDQLATCITLIDIPPSNAIRSPRHTGSYDDHDDKNHGNGGFYGFGGATAVGGGTKTDIRGEEVPDYMECFLVVGLNTGTILFLDLYNSLEVVLSFQAIHGIISDLKYRKRFRELFMFGKDFTQTLSTVRVFKLPELDLFCSIQELKNVSCFNVAPNLNYFGVGCTTGVIRLFCHHIEDRSVTEIVRSSENHDYAVNAICFCDDLRVYVTCGKDYTVNFWDYEKRLVRSVVLNMPSCGLVLNNQIGDVIISQNHYLLTVPRRTWDEDDILSTMAYDNNDQGVVGEGESVLAKKFESADSEKKVEQEQSSTMKQAGPMVERSETNDKNDDATSVRNNDRRRSSNVTMGSNKFSANVTVANDTLSVISAISEGTYENSEKEESKKGIPNFMQTSSPPPSNNAKKLSIAERRMSRRIVQLESKKRFANQIKRKSSNSSAPMPFLFNQNKNDGEMSATIEEATSADEEDDYTKTKLPTEKNFDRVIDSMKDLFEREVVLPHLQDKTFEVIGKLTKGTKKIKDSTASSSAIIAAKYENSSIQRQSLEHSHQTHSHHQYQPQPPPSSIQSLSMTMEENRQPSISPHKPTRPSSSSHDPNSGSYDTLHPKFLLHKKPPARAMKLEDIQEKLQEYKYRINQESNAPDAEKIKAQYAPTTRVHARRFAQFGLSPRARLTLLNSHEVPPPSNRNSAVDTTTSRKASIFSSVGIDFSSPTETDKLVEANLELKLQEQLVVGLGLGMKVSNQYKLQRMNMKKNDAFSILNQKMKSLSKLTEEDNNTLDENGFDEKVLQSKKLANPRVGFMGRKMMPGDHQNNLTTKTETTSNIDFDDEEGFAETEMIAEVQSPPKVEDVKDNKNEAIREAKEIIEETKSELRHEDSRKSVHEVNYNRRKPLLPVSFNPKDIK